MDSREMRRRAVDVAKKAGLENEWAVATHEGSASRTSAFWEAAELSIPGASLLRGDTRRIVLITDKTVRLFAGGRFGKVGRELGTYPVSDTVLAYDDEALIFPDGQSVLLTEHQAAELVAATGGVLNYARANYALRRLGAHDEAGLGTARGEVPGTAHRTAGTVVSDLVASDGVTTKTAEQRLLLLSDKNVRVLRGGAVHEAGESLAVYPVGTKVAVDGRTVTFPDGAVVLLKTPEAAERVADVVANGKAAVD